MIGRLRGMLAGIEDQRCLIDVGGVGYVVQASTRTIAGLSAEAPQTLLIETQVREDAITLYGFADAAERDWFRLLTTIQGVGAKVALAILSTLSPADLARAIAAGDKAALGRASGVGPKLAARLAAELKDKAGMVGAGEFAAIALPAPSGGAAADALSALVNLGYRRPEAEAALRRAVADLGEAASLDALIRAGLKALAA